MRFHIERIDKYLLSLSPHGEFFYQPKGKKDPKEEVNGKPKPIPVLLITSPK